MDHEWIDGCGKSKERKGREKEAGNFALEMDNMKNNRLAANITFKSFTWTILN